MRKVWIPAVLLAALLNLLDTFLTLYLLNLNKGLQEINPLMSFCLENNIFLQVKVLVSLTICLFYSKVTLLVTKIVVTIILIFYSIITVYHILLLRIL